MFLECLAYVMCVRVSIHLRTSIAKRLLSLRVFALFREFAYKCTTPNSFSPQWTVWISNNMDDLIQVRPLRPCSYRPCASCSRLFYWMHIWESQARIRTRSLRTRERVCFENRNLLTISNKVDNELLMSTSNQMLNSEFSANPERNLDIRLKN